jgi:hypothetical protein
MNLRGDGSKHLLNPVSAAVGSRKWTDAITSNVHLGLWVVEMNGVGCVEQSMKILERRGIRHIKVIVLILPEMNQYGRFDCMLGYFLLHFRIPLGGAAISFHRLLGSIQIWDVPMRIPPHPPGLINPHGSCGSNRILGLN